MFGWGGGGVGEGGDVVSLCLLAERRSERVRPSEGERGGGRRERERMCLVKCFCLCININIFTIHLYIS